MKYNQLGRTGLYVSEICLGTMTFGSNPDAGMWKAIGQLPQGEVDAIVGRALAAGVNFIDTADVYSFGKSEKLTGQALKNLGVARKDVVIATKVGAPGPRGGPVGAGRLPDLPGADAGRGALLRGVRRSADHRTGRDRGAHPGRSKDRPPGGDRPGRRGRRLRPGPAPAAQ